MAKLTWSRRIPALAATAVAARGDAGAVLAEKAARGTGLVVDRAGEWTVVRGDDLPWTDGVLYLGELPDAPEVFVPVHERPNAPGEILAASIRGRVGPAPVVMLPGDRDESGHGEGTLVVLRS